MAISTTFQASHPATFPETVSVSSDSRNIGIDFLRGLAVLLVVLHHIGLRFPLRDTALAQWIPKRILNALIYNGYEAVFLFFVISGFLITTHSLQRWGALGQIELKAFYLRRFARIMPSLALIVLIISALHLLGAKHYVIEHEGQSLLDAITSAFGMHLNWYEGQTGYLPGGWDVLWSLSIEEVFYLGFPLLCLLLPSRWALMTVLITLAVSLPITRAVLDDNDIWQEKAYLPGMAAIATGVLAALLAQQSTSWQTAFRRRMTQSLFVIGAIGLFAILFYEGMLWKVLGNGTMLVLTGASACLVLACYWRGIDRSLSQDHPWQPLPGTAWLCTMGRQSYEIYLTHMFAVFSIVELAAWFNSDKAFGFLWYVPALIISWLLGASLERWYSTPCDRLLRTRLLPRPLPLAFAATGSTVEPA